MIKKITLTLSLVLMSFIVNAEVILTNTAFEIVTIISKDGSEQDQWQTPDKLLPGERVGYQIEVHNKGTEPAADIIIENPIPEHTNYVQDSAKGLNARIEFSVNNGKTFAIPSQLFMEKDGQRVQAEAADYTQVRWILDKPLTAGASSTVQYIVKIK
ncbi:MAG: DUF11 domain-containing protein [Oleispira antarctica]|nr:DUF11 domain-containing protein [Oleispira antarctica]MBQ0794121.1 DUF11 domain-containing protein [Oleispira antarctica]|tara:strand:+ start:46 stop:516 length:471 start_codon:yes stop_codon:yes gene_type:complete